MPAPAAMRQLADLRDQLDRIHPLAVATAILFLAYWQPMAILLAADIMLGAGALGLLVRWRRTRTSSAPAARGAAIAPSTLSD